MFTPPSVINEVRRLQFLRDIFREQCVYTSVWEDFWLAKEDSSLLFLRPCMEIKSLSVCKVSVIRTSIQSVFRIFYIIGQRFFS